MSNELTHEFAVIEVSGPDAASFLQGQITNDIHLLASKETPHNFILAAHLNPKGRILATFIICQTADGGYYLITPTTIATKILPRLKMFILRSKVNIQLHQELVPWLSPSALPEALNLQLSPEQWLCITHINQLPATTANWHQVLVEHELPFIYLESYEKIIPQQINYDLIGGISFKKGCYTGQEIVARTHYLGKSKRRLASFTCATTPSIGQTIVSPKLDNQEVGFIIDFYTTADGICGLASLQTDCLDAAYLDSSNQQILHCTSLLASNT